MKRAPFLAALLGVAIIAAAFIYFRSLDSAAPPPRSSAAVPEAQEPGSGSTDGLAGSAPRELPASIVALNEGDDLKANAEELLPRMAALEAQAKTGDARASLQLHLDLQNCANQTDRERRMRDLLNQPPGEHPSEATTRHAIAQVFANQYVAAEKACVGVSEAQLSTRFAHLERAAELGSEQAQLLYRDEGSPVIAGANAMLLDPEELVRFSRKAAEFTQAAARNCNNVAISLLAEDYLIGTLVDQNLEAAFAMRSVLDRLRLSAPMPSAGATEYANGLDSKQLAHARRQGELFHARYCQGR